MDTEDQQELVGVYSLVPTKLLAPLASANNQTLATSDWGDGLVDYGNLYRLGRSYAPPLDPKSQYYLVEAKRW